MESIHDEAAKYGVEMPALDHQERIEDGVAVISLTQESEREWSKYLCAINIGRLTMRSEF